MVVRTNGFFIKEGHLVMTNTRNLPNLAKQIKRIIGQMKRENNQYYQRISSGDYDTVRT